MANPFFKEGAARQQQLMRRRFGPSGGDAHDAQETNIESFRREEDEIIEPVVKVPIRANPQTSSTPVNPPVPAGIDRWHKKSDWYFTVTPENQITSDPDTDPSSYHTITDAINAAKAIYPALALLYTDPIIEIEVHGGLYDELVVIDVDYLRFQGIGRPIIAPSLPDSPVANNALTITSDCTRVLINNFEVINPGAEGYDTFQDTGLFIDEGAESFSGIGGSIQIKNCWFHGDTTVAYMIRLAYFENCWFESDTNLADGSDGGYNCTVFVRLSDTQEHWTKFVNCHFHAYKTVMADYRDRGCAISMQAIDESGGWYANSVKYGSQPTKYYWNGVWLDHCEIDGFTENWGWNIEYHLSHGIEGKYDNSAAGSWHHLIFCKSGDTVAGDVSANTWFDLSNVACRYIALASDIAGSAGLASCNIWLQHMKHTAPDAAPVVQAGSAVVDAIATTHVYGETTVTHAKRFYAIVGPAEGAILTPNCNADASGANTYAIIMNQMFKNY